MDNYKIISGWKESSLEKKVIEHLKLGWIPCGGISVLYSDKDYTYSQSMMFPVVQKSATMPSATTQTDMTPSVTTQIDTMQIVENSTVSTKTSFEKHQMMYYRDEITQEIKYYGVDYCPGIGVKTKELMAKYDIKYLYELVGQFMCFRQDKQKFNDWLEDNFAIINENNRSRCVEAIATYVKNNM